MTDFKLKPPHEDWGTRDEAATILGVSPRRVMDLVKAGIVKKQRHGWYDLKQVARAAKTRAAKKLLAEKPAAEPRADDKTIDEAKRRKTMAEAEYKELRLAELRGQLISVDTYRRKITEMCSMLREHVLGIPAIAPELEGLSAEERKAKLEKVCRAMLSHLADGEFIPPTRNAGEHPGGANGDGLGPASPAAPDAPDGEPVGGPEPHPAQGQ